MVLSPRVKTTRGETTRGETTRGETTRFNEVKPSVSSNNCYSYAFNDTRNYTFKPQPGHLSNITALSDTEYTCDALNERILADNPQAYKLTEGTSTCRDGYYKILLTLDNDGAFRDYHFYKQHDNGLWSHKPGITAVSHVDDSGMLITNPLTSDNNYDNNNDETNFNYNTICGFYCNIKT